MMQMKMNESINEKMFSSSRFKLTSFRCIPSVGSKRRRESWPTGKSRFHWQRCLTNCLLALLRCLFNTLFFISISLHQSVFNETFVLQLVITQSFQKLNTSQLVWPKDETSEGEAKPHNGQTAKQVKKKPLFRPVSARRMMRTQPAI